MKLGVNPDFCDWDEVDQDVLEIVEEFYDGDVTFDELKAIVGGDVAQSILDQSQREDESTLFDDPECF